MIAPQDRRLLRHTSGARISPVSTGVMGFARSRRNLGLLDRLSRVRLFGLDVRALILSALVNDPAVV